MIRSAYPPQYVTALPTLDLFDGMEIYLASGQVGVTWHFRYNATAASAFKWEYVGGPPMVTQDADPRQITNQTAFVNLPTDPMSLALPAGVSGDFDITIEGILTGGATGFAYLSYAVGGTAASDAWAIACFEEAGFRTFSLPKTLRHFNVAPGATIAEKARTGGNYMMQFSNRRLAVLPVRVG